ncbi:MAG: hypothetical protein ACHQFW_05990 [Chitinophagales bacterium]
MSDLNFDAAETSLMFNPDVFLLKRQVNQKIYVLFEQIKIRLKDTSEHKQFSFPDNTDITTGKISQGENYQGCPWIMLDFPRLFTKHEIFAFRTLFWYGHFFTCSILCSGGIAKNKMRSLIGNVKLLHGSEVFFSNHSDAWLHDINDIQFIKVEELAGADIEKHVAETGYFKLSSKFISTKPEEIVSKTENIYRLFLNVLSGSTDAHP